MEKQVRVKLTKEAKDVIVAKGEKRLGLKNFIGFEIDTNINDTLEESKSIVEDELTEDKFASLYAELFRIAVSNLKQTVQNLEPVQ